MKHLFINYFWLLYKGRVFKLHRWRVQCTSQVCWWYVLITFLLCLHSVWRKLWCGVHDTQLQLYIWIPFQEPGCCAGLLTMFPSRRKALPATVCVMLFVIGLSVLFPSEYSTIVVRYVKPIVDRVTKGRSVFLQMACQNDRSGFFIFWFFTLIYLIWVPSYEHHNLQS